MPLASSSSSSSSQSSWTTSILALPTTQQGRLLITSLASITLTAASIFSYQATVRLQRRRDLAKRVDRATHRDEDGGEKKFHIHVVEEVGDIDKDSIDGGTPRYLEHLAHLTPAKGSNRGSPLKRQTSYQSHISSQSIKPTFQASPSTYDESLIREQLSRNYSFLGDDAMGKLRDAFVVIVGLGGVGSHVALSLVRSGVGHIRLIDFDQVSLSSLNRHAVASLDDVGRPKVTICQEHFAGISPWVHIQAWVEVFNESDAPRLFSPFRLPASTSAVGDAREKPVTYVIDCIDNLSTKVGLLAYCHDNGIKVFSSMGAGAKCDPTRICIGDLSATEEDPLAKSVRRRLRERGIPKIDEAKPKTATETANKQGKQKDDGGTGQQKKGKKIASGQESAEFPSSPQQHNGKSILSAKSSRTPFKAASIPPPIALPERRSFSKKRLSRASSASSFASGEGAYFTPDGTPAVEEQRYSLEEGRSSSQNELPSGVEWSEGMRSEATLVPELAVDESTETDETIVPPHSPFFMPYPARPAATLPSSSPLLSPMNLHRASSGLQSLSASPMEEKGQEEITGYLTGVAEDDVDVAPAQSDQDSNGRRYADGQGAGIAANATSPALQDKQREEAERQDEEVQGQEQKGKSTATGMGSGLVRSDEPSASRLAPSNPKYLIPCIFSTEKPSAQLLPLPEAEFQKEGGVEMLRALEDGNEWRVRVLPVLGPLPAIFGLSIASWIICDIAGGKGVGGVDLMEPMESRVRKRAYEKIQRELETLERLYPSSTSSSKPHPPSSIATSSSSTASSMIKTGRGSPFLLDDVLYLVMEVFHSRSIVPPHATVSSHNGLLVRWDSTLPLGYGNVALMTKEQGKRHAIEVLKKGKSPVEVWGEEAAVMWRRRMEEERWYARLR